MVKYRLFVNYHERIRAVAGGITSQKKGNVLKLGLGYDSSIGALFVLDYGGGVYFNIKN